MKFRLVGADRITGREIVLVVEATSEEEVATIASERGLVIASIAKVCPPAADQSNSGPTTLQISVTNDHGLVVAGKWLGAYADWITWAGALYAIGGVCIVVMGFSLDKLSDRVLSVAAGASGIISGVFVLASGAALRMVRAMGLVLLDISRDANTRSRKAD